MSSEKSKYTDGEVLTILAGIINEKPEDCREYFIIVTGKCHDCGQNDGYTTYSNITAPSRVKYVLETACLSHLFPGA